MSELVDARQRSRETDRVNRRRPSQCCARLELCGAAAEHLLARGDPVRGTAHPGLEYLVGHPAQIFQRGRHWSVPCLARPVNHYRHFINHFCGWK